MNPEANISSKLAPSALRVFLVEDSPLVRDILVETLSDIPGVVMSGFSDTEQGALEQLRLQQHDVLILDIELKQGNGINLLRALAESGTQPDLLKIVFSNNVSDTYRRIGLQYGVLSFYDKSSDFAQLRNQLEQLAAEMS